MHQLCCILSYFFFQSCMPTAVPLTVGFILPEALPLLAGLAPMKTQPSLAVLEIPNPRTTNHTLFYNKKSINT